MTATGGTLDASRSFLLDFILERKSMQVGEGGWGGVLVGWRGGAPKPGVRWGGVGSPFWPACICVVALGPIATHWCPPGGEVL